MDKQLIRERVLSQRRGLTDEFVDVRSNEIFQRVIELPVIQNAGTVMTYADFQNEVRTGQIAGWLLYNKKKVALPVIEGDQMYAVPYKGTALKPNQFGVGEPSLGTEERVDPATIDVVICPGVAFSKECVRLGFGRGYYDRFLKLAPNATKMGLAYDFQILASVPADPQDVPMDIIVTPDFIIEKEK